MEEWLYSALRLLLTILIVVSIYTKVILILVRGLWVCLSVRPYGMSRILYYNSAKSRYSMYQVRSTVLPCVRITGKYEYLFFFNSLKKRNKCYIRDLQRLVFLVVKYTVHVPYGITQKTFFRV